VRRENPPDFGRVCLRGDTRDLKEFLNTCEGARLAVTEEGETVTTVYDSLIPVDIFGQGIKAADKAHLMLKASGDAITWFYPACAVLGLSMSPVDTKVTRKAVLGCNNRSSEPVVKYPGIRNFLCNLIRMSNQGALFDQNPDVVILPVYKL